MKCKDRVIVIDLFGESEEAVVTDDKAGYHECRCGVCSCGGSGEGVQLELQLRSYELPAQGTGRPARGVPSVLAPMLAARRYFKH